MERRVVILPGLLEPVLTDVRPEEFASGLPTMVGYDQPLPSLYIDEMERKRRKKYSQDVTPVWDEFEQYTTLLKRVVDDFMPVLSSYDKEIVLPLTCALGMHKSAHSDMDEKGGVGRDRHYAYPPALLRELVKYYAPSVKKALDTEDYSLSAPRGRNSGYPTPKSSRSRECSDVLLFLHSAIAIGSQKIGMDCDALDNFLSRLFGEVLAIAGARQQTKDAWFFEKYRQAYLYAYQFFFRERGIYFSPKYKVLRNRASIKPLQRGILTTDIHDQDRSSIRNRVRTWKSKGWLIWSKDVSKFDQSHGGDIGRALLRLMADILLAAGYSQDMYADFLNEFSTPMLLSDRNGLYVSKGVKILSSGVSMTSSVNCLASHAIVLHVVSRMMNKTYQEAQASYGSNWDAITFGDDIICAIDPRAVAPEFADDAQAAFDSICVSELDLVVTSEPTVKFLGQNYDMLSFKDASTGYPPGRFIQQQFFPERKKRYPFSTIGYIARLELLDDSVRDVIHQFCTPHFEELGLGPVFKCSERISVLRKLLPEVEKYASDIAQLDDVLGVLGHGLDPQDSPELFADLDDTFKDLLALGYVDVSDPSEALRIGDYPQASKSLIDTLHRIQTGDLSCVSLCVSQIAAIYGGHWGGAGNMYF